MAEFKHTYSELLKKNKELLSNLDSEIYNVAVLSNSTVNNVKEILEYNLRVEGINAHLNIGNYDNIVQDSYNYKKSNSVVIFWDLFNIADNIYYKVETLNSTKFKELIVQIEHGLDIVFENLKNTSIVIMNKFSPQPFSSFQLDSTNFKNLSEKLNNYVEKNAPSNFKLINIDDIILKIGVKNSFDNRYFYSSKAFYTVNFFRQYSQFVKPIFMAANGKSKKALIMDCDNTLWHGILGEDGYQSIEMSNKTKEGSIFSEIQNILLSINSKGILLGLCSKNNEADVIEVLNSHPDMQIREKHITINKSNWNDKATNILEISQELNIGLDSIVFIDDSPFEINLVRESLPLVTALKRPENLNDYPNMLRSILDLFYNLSHTKEDNKKIEMYKQQINRKALEDKSSSLESYLVSLKLKLDIFSDKKEVIPRMSQMSQKTNQFNLTTKRYTESDITNFINSKKSSVYSFSVSDKFGNSGLTGLCIVNLDFKSKIAHIDTLLMSCRIIGRNIEFAFFDYLIANLKDRGIEKVESKYIKTPKNSQVSNFFEACSFNLTRESNSSKNYLLNIDKYQTKNINYVEVSN